MPRHFRSSFRAEPRTSTGIPEWTVGFWAEPGCPGGSSNPATSAADISADSKIKQQIEKLQADGYGHYPICIAKTQYSFSTDPAARGAPSGHTVNVREVRLAAGAEFIVVICGDVMTMPGLPKVPSADKIDIDAQGRVVGLF